MIPNNGPYRKPNVDDILKKYGREIENKINTPNINSKGNFSREYIKFKNEMAPELTRYERWCKGLGNLIKLKISEKDKEKVSKQLEIAHLDVEPSQALTLSVMSF